jgi:hypothetical protein
MPALAMAPPALLVDPDTITVPLGICMIVLSFGGAVALMRWSAWMFHPRRLSRQLLLGGNTFASSQDERLKALETYRALASEKMDVIKTAITMGYNERELQRLDARLEQLIGAEALQKLIHGDLPLPAADLGQRDIAAELRALRDMQ